MKRTAKMSFRLYGKFPNGVNCGSHRWLRRMRDGSCRKPNAIRNMTDGRTIAK